MRVVRIINVHAVLPATKSRDDVVVAVSVQVRRDNRMPVRQRIVDHTSRPARALLPVNRYLVPMPRLDGCDVARAANPSHRDVARSTLGPCRRIALRNLGPRPSPVLFELVKMNPDKTR